MNFIAYALILLAVLYFSFKVYVSYDTEGGAIGMVPVLDGAIFPPMMALMGLAILERRQGREDQLLGAPGNWILSGLSLITPFIVAALVIILAGKVGEKMHRRQKR